MSFDHIKKPYPVLVPYWITKQLERHNLPHNSVFNLEKLSSICSPEDLAIMLILNKDPQIASEFFGSKPDLMLYDYWNNNYNTLCKKLVDTLPIHTNPLARLLSEAHIDRFPNAFDIKYIQAEVGLQSALLISIYPGHFGGPTAYEEQTKLTKEYLTQLYVFIDYDAVARDPLFMQYLRTTVNEPS